MQKKENYLHVLVVEDNVINQKIMRAFLRKLGHECTIANNGAEALDLYPIGFDCILMDIQMPVMDGIKATGLIRKLDQEKGVHTPIIAVTASSPYEDQHLFLEVGMDDYMPKPIGMKDLKLLMKNVVSGKYRVKK
ncbi:MAG: response regulator [Bacteroidales bacterium]|nr:response regulator [Bacteroidales bacterium]MCF8343446.1 response regulator [Bacteroidales bacterium]MCF8349901.1 response regulator [Bacteroidales bacterium]MCF8376782.1 response regulator [Bacteroidales bacterium]